MAPKDSSYTIRFDPQEFPMNPQLCSLQTYQTSDEKKYNCMMNAIFTYKLSVAQAEVTLFESLMKCHNTRKR